MNNRIDLHMPGGKLRFATEPNRPGLFAYGARHDYHLHIHDGQGYIGRWAEGTLTHGEPIPSRAESYATVPNATTNQMIRVAEQWEAQQ